MNIVVLCGGTSTEREISLISSEGICKALRSRGHRAVLIDVFLGYEHLDITSVFKNDYDMEKELASIKEKSSEIERLKKERKEFFGPNVIDVCRAADIVFLGLHGANGEDGKIQAVLELLGIPYTGADHLSSAMAMNKSVSRELFSVREIPIAKGFTAYKGMDTPDISRYDMTYPCVVKPSCGGSSVGVYYAENDSEYKEALHNAFFYEDEVIVEECVKGREFSVGVIEYKALPVIEIIPKQGTYDYKNKYTAGAVDEICPAHISSVLCEKIQSIAVSAARALGIDTYCRVDILMDKEENCYCLEANTLPGMTPTSLLPQEAAVVGMDYPALCEKFMEISLKKLHKKKKEEDENRK
ncbi:MAG: D-alanine--D-alanine ligase [Lachnospiraceae bacterium]|nr:D-alanine--D-alanine ligase [Lachnospiraceae bacterium]